MIHYLDKTKSECNDQLRVLQEIETSVSEIQFRASTSFRFPDSLFRLREQKMQKRKIAGTVA